MTHECFGQPAPGHSLAACAYLSTPALPPPQSRTPRSVGATYILRKLFSGYDSFPSFKTDQFGRGASVRLFALPSPLCPVSALAHYSAVRTEQPGPLFIFSDGTFLTRGHIVGVLRSVFPMQAGTNMQSFCIGGAAGLATAGVPEYIIQIIGRWSSDSFLRYI